MTPANSAKSKESQEQKEGAKGHEYQGTSIQGLEQSMITMTVVTQKGIDDSNARFEKILNEMTDYQDGTA